jgi:hypothetical protein
MDAKPQDIEYELLLRFTREIPNEFGKSAY